MNRRIRCCLALAGALAVAAGAAPGDRDDEKRPRLPSDDLLVRPERAAVRFDDFRYSLDDRRKEAAEKVARVRALLDAKKLDGLLIGTEQNFAWITAGGTAAVVRSQRESPVRLLITPGELLLIADNIEGPRVMTEELGGLGYEWVKYPWYGSESEVLGPLLRGKRIAFDLPAAAAAYRADPVRSVLDFRELYFPIAKGELEKLRWLGRKTCEVLQQVSAVVRPGMTERDVQALVDRELSYWGIFPTVTLTAADERFRTYRHPVVQGAPVKTYLALNVCARKWGLVVSTTRVLHFGPPDPKLARAWIEGAKVCAAMWAATKPEAALGSVVRAAQAEYEAAGFPDEWKLHHQGGPILTLERLFLVTPDDRTPILPGMTLAWNPTLQGAKFEDTIYVKVDGSIQILTPPLQWPVLRVKVGETVYSVPALKVLPVPGGPG